MYMDGVRKGQVFLSNRACNYKKKMWKNYFTAKTSSRAVPITSTL
jgi:hypothetical protein